MWNGSKYSMAVRARMLCLFSSALPPVLSCDWFSLDFQQWESSWCSALSSQGGSPSRAAVPTEPAVGFSAAVLKMQPSHGVTVHADTRLLRRGPRASSLLCGPGEKHETVSSVRGAERQRHERRCPWCWNQWENALRRNCWNWRFALRSTTSFVT